MDINLTTLFDDFYHTRFFVLICMSVFTLLFSLRLDNTLKFSYWIVFTPLWIWKLTALLGMIVGTIVWIKTSRRFDRDTFIQFKGMLISFSTNLILFMFEVILCDKLETNRNVPWSICFIPLYILSLISIGTSIWSIRYDRSYEIELFCSLNVLQFVFISLRLDSTITWSWILVLIPVWICMSIGFIVLLYVIILTLIVTRTSNSFINQHHRQLNSGGQRAKQKWSNVVFYTMFLFGLLTFEILLTNKLDFEMSSSNLIQHIQNFINLQQSNQLQQQLQQQQNQNSQYPVSSMSNHHLSNFYIQNFSPYHPTSNASSESSLSYFLVSIPLYVSYLSLILLSFNSHTGNVWWFGLRRDFCGLFLHACPFLKTYGNIEFKSSNSSKHNLGGSSQPRALNTHQSNETSLVTFAHVTNVNNNGLGSNSTNNYVSLSLLDTSALANNLEDECAFGADGDNQSVPRISPSSSSQSRKQIRCLNKKGNRRISKRIFNAKHQTVLVRNEQILAQKQKRSSRNFAEIMQLDLPD